MHLPNGSLLTTNDSTSNGNNFTQNSSPAATAGEIDGSAQFNGSNNLSRASLTIPTAAGTVSAWWRPDNDPLTNMNPVFTSRNGSSNLFDLYPWSDGNLYAGWYLSAKKRVVWPMSGTISQGNWYYLTLTWTNGGSTILYVNGANKGSTSGLNTTWDTSVVTTYVARDNNQPTNAMSTIDEVRLSNSVHSTSWISTEYNNQSSPSTFYSVFSEEQQSAAGQVIMASSTPAIATGRVKYRLSVPASQAAGTYTNVITYTITGTY